MNSEKKIKELPALIREVIRLKKMGKTVVTTNGCFDILHAGHVKNLRKAKSLGDVLIVGINSDRSVKLLKGASRPIMGEKDRSLIIAALECVDGVFIFDDGDPRPWIGKLKPHIHVKGADRKPLDLLEKPVVEKCGGKVVLIPLAKGRSTTNIIQKIVDSTSSRRRPTSR